MSVTCPTRIAVDADNVNGVLSLKFRVTSGPRQPQTPLSVLLDAPPLDDFLRMRSDPNVPTDVVENAGRALCANLAQDPNFTPSLLVTRQTVQAGQRRILIEIPDFALAAQSYPWEVIHDGADFIATNPGIAITRTISPLDGAARASVVLDGGLRIISIIAAAGVDGRPEWDALEAAMANYQHECHCTVLVSHGPLRDHIQQAADPRVTVEMVPDTESALLARIDQVAPHICHIFCHGSRQNLEIANNLTNFGDRALTLSSPSIASHLRSAWLVVLNACSSGAADAETKTNSIGCDLVALGIPFVTSMRQDILASAAHSFTLSFLGQALSSLSRDVPAGRFTLNFDDAMVGARLSLAAAAGGANGTQRTKEWTLPILCASPDDVEVTIPAPRESAHDLTALISQIAEYRKALETPGWSEAERAAIQNQIDALSARLTGASDH